MAQNPAGVQVQPMAMNHMQAKKPMSIWWPMGFLIAWIVFSALGGGLIGAGYNSVDDECDEYECYDVYGDQSLIIGGIACLSICGILGLTFWILLIVYLVKRSHYQGAQHPNIVYTNGPPPVAAQPTASYPQYNQQQYPQYPQQQPQHFSGYYQQPQQQPYGQQAPYMEQNVAAPREMQQSEPASSVNHPGSPAPESQGTAQNSHCTSCGAVVTTPFCAQCGNRA